MGSSYKERTVGHQKLLLWRIRPEWRDPNCINPSCTSDGKFMQDYLHKPELAIQWWNLSVEVFDKYKDGEVFDVRVYVEDEVEDPMNESSSGRKLYNWARSENVLEQICRNPVVVSGGERSGASSLHDCEITYVTAFINDNPYDSIVYIGESGPANPAALKRVHYSGNTTDDDTAFIYVRNDSGDTYLNFYIGVQVVAGGNVIDTDSLPDEITVRFSSSESEIPGTMVDPEHGNVIETKAKACWNFVGPPSPEMDEYMKRISYLLNGEGASYANCRIYSTTLRVSDSHASCSTCDPPVLYVSSSDHKWEYDGNKNWDKRMDYTISVDDDSSWMSLPVTLRDFTFGKRRGMGVSLEEPSAEDKSWYSYDEFMTSGGIEVVYAELLLPDCPNYIPQEGFGKNHVAVQSEADILIVSAHGASSGKFGADFVYPYYENDQIPESFFSRTAWDTAHIEHDPTTESYSDYLSEEESFFGNAWGHNKSGLFWQKKGVNPELRWLTVISCNILSIDGGGVNAWKNRIGNGDNFLSSVCGFRANTDIKLNFQSLFFERYGYYMEAIFNLIAALPNGNPYEPQSRCGYPENIELWSCPRSRDTSVSAFMEAVVVTLGRRLTSQPLEIMGYTQIKMTHCGLNWAAAIGIDKDDNNEDHHFKYYLTKQNKDYETFTREKNEKFTYKITRRKID